MAEPKLFDVGVVTSVISKYTSVKEGLVIKQSTGLRGHIYKRHSECMKYISKIPDIIENPDYVGSGKDAFELVKTFDRDIQLGIKVDTSGEYCYVATLHIISRAKVLRRVHSGRLHDLTSK